MHTSPGGSSDIKLTGGRFFDWITAGKQVYTDLTWSIGFAPYWLAAEQVRRGIGSDRILFATDQPWGDFAGEYHRMMEALGDQELTELSFHGNVERLYG